MFLQFLISLIFPLVFSDTLCPAVEKCLSNLTSDSICPELLPVPPRSFPPPPPPFQTFTLTPVRPGVFIFFDGSYLSIILRAGSRLAMIDLLPTANIQSDSGTLHADAAEQILNGTVPTRIDIVYSHAHMDHIGATVRFTTYMKRTYPNAKILIWGTEEADQLAKDSTSGMILRPNVLVRGKGKVLRLRKGLKVHMEPVGGHTQQDLLLHIPTNNEGQGVVMMVDIVFPRYAPPFFFGTTQDLRRYVQAHDIILKKDFGVYVGGHIQIGTRDDVMESKQYVQNVIEAAGNAVREVGFPQFVQAGFLDTGNPNSPAFRNVWFPFIRVSRLLRVDFCYKEIVRKWGCRIGSVDITARGHCFTALQFLNIDF